jgi:mono/diheme cytochrome c family protein
VSAASVIGLLLFWIVYLSWQKIQTLQWTPENTVVAVIAMGLTIAISLGGAILFAQTERNVQQQKNQPPKLVNPIFADQSAISRGREIFHEQCWVCHGENGQGEMPFAANLSRPIPNLSTSLTEQTDEDLFRILSQGVVNRHMFGINLSESARWSLVNYLRYMDI